MIFGMLQSERHKTRWVRLTFLPPRCRQVWLWSKFTRADGRFRLCWKQPAHDRHQKGIFSEDRVGKNLQLMFRVAHGHFYSLTNTYSRYNKTFRTYFLPTDIPWHNF